MQSSETISNSISWSSSTNWIVAAGSIRDSITFESSLSLINDDQHDEHDLSSTATSAPNSPLILYSPPSPISTPCEITITFPQKHEVQQIYIRSTARIYEIYYASEVGGCNEYLCTVRCGIATRDEQVLQATDIEKAVYTHQKGSTKELEEGRESNGSNSSGNEDDWVEVKLLSTSLVVNGNSSQANAKTNEERISQKQDFYEATAEISDASPCASVTLRLLSLQNKSCVCIDEIYVFADPVDETDSDNKAGPTESASGSSLMAMFMPAFMELSKSKRSSQVQDKLDINKITKQESAASVEKSPDPVYAENNVSDGGKAVRLQEAVTPVSENVETGIPPQVSDKESKHEIPQSHLEGVLDKLVSRVDRIEDLFLKFENSLLNPIKSIDERLQRVEKHLEVLTKKTQDSGLLPCTRISAPEFSCSESETNSLYNSGCIDVGDATSEANKKDSVPFVPSNVSPVTAALLSSTNTPGFSNGDEGEENDAEEPPKESPKKKQEKALSIDDALASALARFMSSTSVKSPKYSKVLSVKAPEFPNEEGDSNDKTASAETHCKIRTEPPISSPEFEETECVVSSSSAGANETEREIPKDNNCEGVDEQLWKSRSGEIIDEIESGENGNETSETTETDQCFGDGASADSENTKDVEVENKSSRKTEITVLDELQKGPLKVDFEIPILEVKFTSGESSDAKSFLDALLQDSKDENRSANEKVEDSLQSEDLIPVEDFGEAVAAIDGEISVDADYCSLTALPLNTEGVANLI